MQVFRLCVRNPASRWLQISHKLKKWQRRHRFLTLFCFFCQVYLLVQVSCQYHHWYFMIIIFFYKGLTRKPEIGNTAVLVLPNIWRLGQVRDTRFGTDVSNEMVINVAKCQSYSSCRFWVIKGNPIERVKLPPKMQEEK